MKTVFDKYKPLMAARKSLLGTGRDPFGVVIDHAITSVRAMIDGKETLILGTNNYLGMSQSDKARAAAIAVVNEEGVGTCGSRIANGSYGIHQKLERKIADVFGFKHAMIFSTGYQANLGTISGLVDKNDLLFLDADCHASIYDGAKLSGAQVIRFRHNDPADLEKRLKRVKDHDGAILIVTEGIYSMTGNIAPMKEFVRIKKEYGAYLVDDEAHSFGIYGPKGLGIAEQDGCLDEIDFVVGTFSKSLGTVGGYCVTNHDEIDILRITSRPYMFTASVPPEVAASTLAALEEVMENGKPKREQIQKNAKQFFEGCQKIGFKTGKNITPIIGVKLNSIPEAIFFWNRLMDKGVYVNLSLPPATPDEHPLLRCSVTAAHTEEDINEALKIFAEVAEEAQKMAAQ